MQQNGLMQTVTLNTLSTHARTHASTHARIRHTFGTHSAHIRHTHARSRTRTHAHTRARMHAHTHARRHTHTHTHTHTHKHKHTFGTGIHAHIMTTWKGKYHALRKHLAGSIFCERIQHSWQTMCFGLRWFSTIAEIHGCMLGSWCDA